LKKFIFLLVLSAVLLTACKGKAPDPVESFSDTREPVTSETQILPLLVQEDGLWYLEYPEVRVLLVNKVYGLPEDFGGEDPEARAALDTMIAAAAQDGLTIYLQSGYRSYETQAAIHARYDEMWGEEYTDTVSAEPGHSEHQTGMAFDLLGTSEDTGLSESFANTPEGKWLAEHCWAYGVILRYPENGTESTGYLWEPWHFRWIGNVDLARSITESGLTLEQYAGLAE